MDEGGGCDEVEVWGAEEQEAEEVGLGWKRGIVCVIGMVLWKLSNACGR